MPNDTGRNQYKPNPPLDDVLEAAIRHYWKMGMTDPKILDQLLKKHIDKTKYGLGIVNFKKMRKSLGLNSTVSQAVTVDDLVEPMVRLRERYPKAGARDMKSHLFHEESGVKVPKARLYQFMEAHEPDLLRKRKGHRLKRKRFWAAGVNDLWCFDQHDKWQQFGLKLHNCVEPVSGRILWLRVWHSNRHSHLVASYYFDVVEELGFIPLITQSDRGKENYGIAKAQTALRHYHDASLEGTIQHRWTTHLKNVKPEITWRQMRTRFTPGFEDKLNYGVTQGWYVSEDPLHRLIFLWVFIPWLQLELDRWRDEFNFTRPRHDKTKVLPHGVPEHIFEDAAQYGVTDFKVQIDRNSLPPIRRVYAPADSEVFELVPAAFATMAQVFYEQIGSPVIAWSNVWQIYGQILHLFRTTRMDDPAFRQQIEIAWNPFLKEERINEEDASVAMPEGRELLEGFELEGEGESRYLGGVNGGAGYENDDGASEEMEPQAIFTDEEVDSDEAIEPSEQEDDDELY